MKNIKGKVTNLAEVKKAGYEYHHAARKRGYISRKNLPKTDKDIKAVPYKGRFGEGFTTYSPCFDSSQYIWIAYYVK